MTRVHRWLPSSLLVLAVALGGCVGEEPPGETSLELGTGSWQFEPVVDGDRVPLIRGAQGGWHFWLSARATGMTDEGPNLVIEMQLADESMPAQRMELPVLLERPDDEGRRAVVGLTAIVQDPGCAVDQLMRVTITLEGEDGTQLVDERYLEIDPGADPPPSCGEEIHAPG